MRLIKEQSPLKSKPAHIYKWLVLGLIIYLPLHLFIAQSLGELTGARDVIKTLKDFVIIFGGIYSLWYLLSSNPNKWTKRVIGLSLGYLLLHLLFIFFIDLDLESALLATTYNVRLFALLAIGLGAGKALGIKFSSKLSKVLLFTALGVTVFGLLQLLLPEDFLTHFGYSFENGAREYFSIDSKPGLTRIFSTIRDPNSLGAYLVIVCSLTFALFLNKKKRDYNLLALIILMTGAIGFTFSRSAWIGGILATALIIYWSGYYKKLLNKRFLLTVSTLLLVTVSSIVAFRDTYVIENVIWHSDESTVLLDSNEKRLRNVQDSVEAVLEKPAGHGPGTAGIVSIRNPNGAVLNENYYLQIGYEVGLVGLALFIWLNVEVYNALRRSKDGYMRIGLMVSFWGLVITNMLLHSWSNEAVVIWWLLAGYQIGGSD